MNDQTASDDVNDLLGHAKRLLQVIEHHSPTARGRERFDEAVSEHLGQPGSELPVVREEIALHRYVDYDLALAMVAERDAHHRTLGVGGGDHRHHMGLADMLQEESYGPRLVVGQVDYANLACGPDVERACIVFGARLFRYDGAPVFVLLRQANPHYGQERGAIEVLSADRDLAQRLLSEIRERSITHSVLRGQVVTLTASGYEHTTSGVTFVARPAVDAAQVILPDGVLDRVRQHVIGIADHRDALRRYGQHLKRGVLLFGPPGSGKTHTVRHLLAETPDQTVVLLAGETLRFVSLAAQLARALQPAIVVLEDCDLVAEDRDMFSGAKPLLFDVLDAMDGLDSDADVTFLLTTNRVEALERALSQRPGRVDLAVEIPLPDEAGRRALLQLYSPGQTFSEDALREAAQATEGTTASFTKELIRRAVLLATVAEEEPSDTHLRQATAAIMSDADELSRVLLGQARAGADESFDLGLSGPLPGVAAGWIDEPDCR